MFREIASTICILIGVGVMIIACVDYVLEQRGLDLIEDDGQLEELVEAAIKAKTGLDIDLTPDSPEKK